MFTDPTAALFDRLRTDSDVLGVFLSGSRGKGFHTDTSDYDVYIVVTDEGLEPARTRYPFRYRSDIDCIVTSLSEFRTYAEPGSPDVWDRYDFAHVKFYLAPQRRRFKSLSTAKANFQPRSARQLSRAYSTPT